MTITTWLSDKYIEIFGAVTGIIYVFLEIRQTIWLWPVGIITSAFYIWIFFSSKFYADASLQGYYLAVSFLGWYWWVKGTGHRAQGAGRSEAKIPTDRRECREQRAHRSEAKIPLRRKGSGQGAEYFRDEKEGERKSLKVTRLTRRTGVILSFSFILIYTVMWLGLSEFTDSPVPQWDSFITTLSVIATWMLARKIYEHWYLWIIVNFTSVGLFLTRGLYPTVVLYFIYGIMSFAGLVVWRKSLKTYVSQN